MRKRPQTSGLDAALALYLMAYCAVAGCFGLVLYELLQPSRIPNVGLAAYTPPPGTVINYAPANRLQADRSLEQTATSAERPAAVADVEPETTGAAVRSAEAEPPPAVAPTERPRLRRAVAKNTQQRREEDWNWTHGDGASRYENGSGRYDYGRSRYAEPWSGGSRRWW